MRLSDLQTALQRYGFDTSDPLTTWINAALSQFVDAYTWPFLESFSSPITVNAGVNTITAPALFRKIRTIRNLTTKQKLVYWNFNRFQENISDPSETGDPEIYTLISMGESTTGTIQIWRVPTVATNFSVGYRRSVPDLVNATDVPAIPTEYHYTLVRGAAWIALQAENEEDRAESAFSAWQNDPQRAIEFYSTHEDDVPNTVEDAQGYL